MKRLITALALAGSLSAQVSYERLVNANKEPQNWLTYWGDYSAVRYRELNQIHTGNVKDLRADWMFQTGVAGAFETMPLVVDGIMYFTAAGGNAYAIDARSGRQLWHYGHVFPPDRKRAGGRVNRGMAVLGERLFMVTGDGMVLSLDIRNGNLLWQSEMAPFKQGTYYATIAP